MAPLTRNITQTYTIVDCGGCCGASFGMPDWLHTQVFREGSRGFHCPACGAELVRSGKSDLEKERERKERAEARIRHERDQREATERSLAATKGHLTRAKKRSAHGVCPCCNRTFENIARHMASKHPEFVQEHG